MVWRLNLAQRIVAVIGLGAGLFVFGAWAMTWGTHMPFPTGWTGYAPLLGPFAADARGGLSPGERLVIWIALIAVWTVLAVLVFRTAKPKSRIDS